MPLKDSEQQWPQSNTSPDASADEHHAQQGKEASSHPTLFTEEGRLALYAYWAQPRFADGRLERGKSWTPQEKVPLFADWLRTLVTDGKLDPRTRLPAYQVFANKPFYLKEKWVAQAIRQLRDERVLPKRKTRKDKGHSQWTERDEYCFWLIGHMRALRIDQLQRVLAEWSEEDIKKGIFSLSRTVEIVDRWEEEKYVTYVRINYRRSGWVYMTRKGLRHAGLSFRAGAPSERILDHLYWINEVRMKLEATYPEMQWISERAIQAEQEKRYKGERLKHFPDGILLLPGPDGKQQEIDIEVQISKPAPAAVKDVMSDRYFSGSDNPLQYYVNKESRGVIKATYQKMVKEQKAMRPSIEIIDLEKWLPPRTARR